MLMVINTTCLCHAGLDFAADADFSWCAVTLQGAMWGLANTVMGSMAERLKGRQTISSTLLMNTR